MAVELDAVVAELVARSGARAARVVDARTGTVLAAVGAGAGDEVATLVRMARDATPMRRAGGGVEDLVLVTADAVHVLRSLASAFLHLRVDAGSRVDAARRELASPALHRALSAALAPVPELPRPRTPVDDRDSRPAPAALARPGPTAGPGAPGPALTPDAPVRAPAAVNQNWSLDVETMRRLAAGLRRLN